jgi:hypothetical protein
MLNQLNKILILLEDAVDTENWDLVREAMGKLEEMYERIEIENDLGDSFEE